MHRIEAWTDADIIRWVSQQEYNRARRLNDQGAGRLLCDDPDRIEAEYTERGQVFRVIVAAGQDPERSRSSCSCPDFETGMCRHVAGAVLLARRQRYATAHPHSLDVAALLSHLRPPETAKAAPKILGFQIAFGSDKPLRIVPVCIRTAMGSAGPLDIAQILEQVPHYADGFALGLLDILRSYVTKRGFVVPKEEIDAILPTLQTVHAFVRDPKRPLIWKPGPHKVRFVSADSPSGTTFRGLLTDTTGKELPLRPQACLLPTETLDWLFDGDATMYALPLHGDALFEALMPGPYTLLPRDENRWFIHEFPKLSQWGEVEIHDNRSPRLVHARAQPVVLLEEKGTSLRVAGCVRYLPSQQITRLLAPKAEPTPVMDGRHWYLRDVEAELRYAKLLSATLLTEPVEEPGVWLLSPDRALRFLDEEIPKLDGAWEIFGRDDLAELKIATQPMTPHFRVTSGLDWFDTAFEFEAAGEVIDGWELLRAFENGQRYWKTSQGYFKLPVEWLRRLRDRLREIPEGGRLHRAHVALIRELQAEMVGFVADDGWKKAAEAFHELRPVAVPTSLQASLRPYQCEGLNWLVFLARNRFGGILADDMGLGKTLQALAFLLYRKERGAPGPTLIVAPSSVVFNWERECAKFAPTLTVLRWTGEQRNEQQHRLDVSDVVLTSYAILRRDIGLLAAQPWQCVILDEAQAIKNARSQTAECARALQARFRLALSGTPIENHLGELWSYFEFLMPGFLGSERHFRACYVERFDQPGSDACERLRYRIGPFVLRRLKQQVATELPPKTEIVVACELGEAQRNLYEAVRAAYKVSLGNRLAQEGLAKSRMHVLEALLRLRQACCDPRLLPIDEAKRITESAKADELYRIVDAAAEEDHKVIIFSQFTEMLDLLQEGLLARGLSLVRLDGSTVDRATPIERFQNDPACKVFLISLRAGGAGLNLTAADYVIHYDPWWNPAVEDQATDRAYRIGQTRPVFVYKLIAKGTVEELMLDLQAKKRGLVDGLMAGEDGAQTLGIEDLKMIFGLPA